MNLPLRLIHLRVIVGTEIAPKPQNPNPSCSLASRRPACFCRTKTRGAGCRGGFFICCARQQSGHCPRSPPATCLPCKLISSSTQQRRRLAQPLVVSFPAVQSTPNPKLSAEPSLTQGWPQAPGRLQTSGRACNRQIYLARGRFLLFQHGRLIERCGPGVFVSEQLYEDLALRLRYQRVTHGPSKLTMLLSTGQPRTSCADYTRKTEMTIREAGSRKAADFKDSCLAHRLSRTCRSKSLGVLCDSSPKAKMDASRL